LAMCGSCGFSCFGIEYCGANMQICFWIWRRVSTLGKCIGVNSLRAVQRAVLYRGGSQARPSIVVTSVNALRIVGPRSNGENFFLGCLKRCIISASVCLRYVVSDTVGNRGFPGKGSTFSTSHSNIVSGN